MLEHIFTLLVLILLQAVLGFDNLLYISLESKRVEQDKQKLARNLGIGLAIFLRIGLLILLMSVIDLLKEPVITLPAGGFISAKLSIHSIIVLVGGIFIIYTAVKEIFHMLSLDEAHQEAKKKKSLTSAVLMIVLMNIVFSFDSILSAIALTEEIWVMATAIVIGGILMILLSNTISEFLRKNRMYEVLGLFILFVVGIMLLSEGGHLGKLTFWGHEIHAMSKSTFYFVIGILVIVDIVQGRYIRKLAKMKNREEV